MRLRKHMEPVFIGHMRPAAENQNHFCYAQKLIKDHHIITKVRIMRSSIACQTKQFDQKNLTRQSAKHLIMERLNDSSLLDKDWSVRA